MGSVLSYVPPKHLAGITPYRFFTIHHTGISLTIIPSYQFPGIPTKYSYTTWKTELRIFSVDDGGDDDDDVDDDVNVNGHRDLGHGTMMVTMMIYVRW